MDCKLGHDVGYKIRCDDTSSSATAAAAAAAITTIHPTITSTTTTTIITATTSGYQIRCEDSTWDKKLELRTTHCNKKRE